MTRSYLCPRGLAIALALVLGLAQAHAEPGIATYALVVGSNAAGPGQAALKYAEDDARRVAATLQELGGYEASSIDVIAAPTPDEVRQHLAKLAAKVVADRAAGRQARVLFYYSGHARSTALDLGNEELALGELRQKLFAIPATLTIVVLDACQSGAFSRIKGAAPAADFSFNSKQRLDASGIAVLASSSGSELSQESEQLRSSYFTHHLLVGLRGAGDTDRDGQVSLDEAYRYAYNQTLVATAATAVGSQHVSLEVDLKGHGQVPLSFPRAATASIELPAALQGQTLVEDARAGAVVAETYKARGAAVRIAVAPGAYRVLVRSNGRLSRCEVTAGNATIDLARCPSEAIVTEASKGGGGPRWRFELGTAAGAEHRDGFTRTLANFGYNEELGASFGLTLAGLRRVEGWRHLWLGGFATYGGAPQWTMSTERHPLIFSWQTATLGALARGVLPFTDHGFWRRFAGYAQLGLGLSTARTAFSDQDGMLSNERFFGWAVTGGAGVHVAIYRGLGIGWGYSFDYAPVIDNLTGDTHASGGHRVTAIVSYSY